MRTWKDVATLVKTRNLKGKFVARCAADFPYLVREGTAVAFVPPQTDLPRRARVSFTRDIDGRSYEIGFDTIGDETLACNLVGCHCLARREDIEDMLDGEDAATWVGWRIVADSGEHIGEAVALVENPGQALLEVRRPGGKLAYIPAVDAFICAIDEDNRVISVDLPAGLLDL